MVTCSAGPEGPPGGKLTLRHGLQEAAERTFKEAVDRDWEYSRTCGITAVPTFMVDGRKVVGAQPYQALEDLVRAAGANMRK
jgi:predicted DsbA family dithiol-disulfide isomerase